MSRPKALAAAPFGALLVILSATAPHSLARANDTEAVASVSVRELLGDPAKLVAFVSTHQGDVRAAAARVEQARADVAQSHLLPNPTLNVFLNDLALGTTNPPGLGFNETAIYGFTLTQTLEIGKRGPREEGARLRAAAIGDSYRDTLGDRVAAARAALGRTVYVGERQRALEDSFAAARQVLALQKTRFERGDVSGNDYDRLSLDTAVLEADVDANRNDLAAALRDCGAALQATCDAAGSEASLLDEASPRVAPPADLDAWLDARPDIQSLQREQEAARADAALAHHRRIPDPGLSVGYTRDRLVISGDQPRTLGFALTLPVPAFDRGQHDEAKAEAHARELDQTRRAARARARAELESLLARQAFLQDALARLRDDSVPRSRRVLDSTVAAVSQGELSMTDLLLARRTHVDLTLRLLQLQMDAFGVASELRHALALDAPLAGDK